MPLFEIGAGCAMLGAYGIYNAYKLFTSSESEPEVDQEPPSYTEVVQNQIEDVLKMLQETCSEMEWTDLMTSWFSVGFYLASASVVIWTGVLQPMRARKRAVRSDLQLTDLINDETNSETCEGEISVGHNELEYTSERGEGQYSEEAEALFTEAPAGYHVKLALQNRLQNGDQYDTYTDAAADEYEEEGGEEIGRRGRQEGVVDECRGKSFAISGSDGGLIGGDPLDRPPASFLSQISDRDKARVEKILKSNADDPLPPASIGDDDSNFCTTSMSSRGQPQTPLSVRGFQSIPLQPSTIHRNGSLPLGLNARDASFGDVNRGISSERSGDQSSMSDRNKLLLRKGSLQNCSSLARIGIEAANSSTSSRSKSGVEKLPTGNHPSSARLQGSKIPVKRSSSLKKSRQRVPSNKEVETPKGSKCGSERSRASQLPVAGSRSSGKACSVLGAKNDSKSQSICNSVVGAERRAAFSCSEESEVSVQSLLDQSEFSLLTSSPEAKMPIGYADQQHNRSRLSKSLIGKSIDDKFSSLLDVVIRNCDDIKALYRANSGERVNNNNTNINNNLTNGRSNSQNRKRVPRGGAGSNITGVRNNRAKSCPRGVRNHHPPMDRPLGSETSGGFTNSFTNEKSSSSGGRSYMNGGNYYSINGSYNNSLRHYPRAQLNPRLKNPPMRFGNEDKTVFIAAGHYRPSDLEIIRQRSNLRHVEMNLTK